MKRLDAALAALAKTQAEAQAIHSGPSTEIQRAVALGKLLDASQEAIDIWGGADR